MITRILAISVLSASATIAHAETSRQQFPALRVRYQDLDLGTEQGALTLYKRITSAAREVCPVAGNDLNMRSSRAVKQCIAQAVSRAVADVNSPQLAKVEAASHARPRREG